MAFSHSKLLLVVVYFVKMNCNVLKDRSIWQVVLDDFKERNSSKSKKIKAYKQIIDSGEYQIIADALLNYTYKFSLPRKVEINKFHSLKKKTVFIFNYRDDFVLKVVNRLLIENYGDLVSSSCHSFQKHKGAKSAFRSLLKDKQLDDKYVLKTDISNYFNSVNVEDFFKILPKSIKSNKLIYSVISQILLSNNVIFQNRIISENKGLMAGSPIAPFLSNIYLKDIDDYFSNKGVTYARYSDDLIVFDSKAEIESHFNHIQTQLSLKNLIINKQKTTFTKPKELWTFLGFSYKQGVIDISDSSQKKLKMKIRRLSRRYYRLLEDGKRSENELLIMFIDKINKKMFGKNKDVNDLCWSMWYFPLINTSKTLKKIDKIIQDRLRFSVCGQFSKKNYKKIPYKMLQSAGYKSIRRTYYLFKYDFEKFNKYVQQ